MPRLLATAPYSRTRFAQTIQKDTNMTSTSVTAVVLLDPTSERLVADRQLTARPGSLDGLTVGLLDISKARGDVFLDQIERRLIADGMKVQRFRKPTFAKPAPIDLRHEISVTCDVVIEALAD
jgi:hypothetical protein